MKVRILPATDYAGPWVSITPGDRGVGEHSLTVEQATELRDLLDGALRKIEGEPIETPYGRWLAARAELDVAAGQRNWLRFAERLRQLHAVADLGKVENLTLAVAGSAPARVGLIVRRDELREGEIFQHVSELGWVFYYRVGSWRDPQPTAIGLHPVLQSNTLAADKEQLVRIVWSPP